MTKEKVKYVIKRLPYILEMIRKGISEKDFYISKNKEKIIIDEEVFSVIRIVDEIIENEQASWLKRIFIGIKNGKSDVAIILNSPAERTKYYEIKREFINKIYTCCVSKGLVSYEEVLKSKIG
ncbi:MAG: hypothetical protein E7348_05680 [Clostridiales bacterium]|nr:hypothetical protein [Clostridiales bacterium]